MFVKKHFFLLLLIFLLPACGKGDTDGTVPKEEIPSVDTANPGDGAEDITLPSGTSEPASEIQGDQPAVTNALRAAEDMPEQEQEVGRKGGKMLPVELIDPAEYANFEKECQDYSSGDDHRGNIKQYVLDGSILYVKSPDFGDPLIYCLDLENKDCYPLCSKPECFHNSQTCNAFAESTAYKPEPLAEEYTGIAWINLYQDRLVLFDTKKLFYRRLDGIGGEDIGSLMPNFTSPDHGMNAITIMTHRGYVYTGQIYYTKNGSILRFIRMSISGGEQEVIWEYARPGIGQNALNMRFSSYCGLGDKVYFFIIDERLANGGTSTKLYCYDTIKDEVSLYWEFEGEIGREYPRSGKWYYVYESSFYSWDPATGEECCLYANTEAQYQDPYGITYYNGGFCLWDGEEGEAPDSSRWWYPSIVRWVHFYDWDGNHIAQVEPPHTENPAKFFTSGFLGDYLIYRVICDGPDGYQYYTAVLDTSRLGDPSLEWMLFELAAYFPE